MLVCNKVECLVLRLRGRGKEGAEEEEDSAVKREKDMLAEMGFEYVQEDEVHGKFDAEGRKITPAAPTIPGELCSDDDLSDISGPSELDSAVDDAQNQHTTNAEYMPTEGRSGVPPLLSTVKVKYYDLSCGATYNISDAFPEQPRISGLWQLALRVHSREFTFCAHRGIIMYDPTKSPFGKSMCVRRVGQTALQDDEVVRALRTLHHRFNPMTFDLWHCTSIDFCEQLVYIISTSQSDSTPAIPRQICVPILLRAPSDDAVATWGSLSVHNRTVEVCHLSRDLDQTVGEALADLFRR
jgi:hypothetical protein